MRWRRSRTLWWVGAAALTLYSVSRSGLDPRWVGLIEDVVSALAVLAVWVVVRRRDDSGGRPWLWICLALGCWVAGDFAWDGYAFLGIARPEVSFADLFYLAGYPFLATGLFHMARARAGRYARDGFLDGAIFGVASAVAAGEML